MKQLQKPQGFVRELCSFNSADNYTFSIYNTYKEIRDKYILMNQLTREVLELSADEANQYKSYLTNNPDSVFIDYLKSNGFLVPESINELERYIQILKINRQFRKISEDKCVQYKIFTTTGCNARCFYCFEEGMKTTTMTMETAENIVKYILKTASENRFTLYWFGGEPLCNIKVIDYICDRLHKENKHFVSKIITNGYLFNDSTVQKAKTLWNLEFAQITLDGTETEHNKRKAYVSASENPFKRTIFNIQNLLDNNIRVVVRLNFDENNYKSIYELVDYLAKKFSKYEKFFAYPAIISNNWLNHKIDYDEKNDLFLRNEYTKICNKLKEYGLYRASLPATKIKPYYCIAANPRVKTINPEGKLFTCQACDDALCYGNVCDGVLDQKLKYEWENCVDVLDKCKKCEFLPLCCAFDKCTTDKPYCYEEKSFNNTNQIERLIQEKSSASNKMFFNIAGFNFSYFESNCFMPMIGEKYIIEETKPNLQFDENLYEKHAEIGSKTQINKAKSITTYRGIAEWLPKRGAFVVHAATFDVDGEGVALCALSGTGKTTQMLNWQKYLGEKMTIVNGDKPIIRFFDKDFCEQKGLKIPEGTEFGVPYAYGTPWNGKERYGCNMRTKLKHICFIERSETNFVIKIDKADAVERIMKQVYIPKDPEALHKTLELVNRLINSCDLWIIHCNMDIESAEIAYKAIIGG